PIASVRPLSSDHYVKSPTEVVLDADHNHINAHPGGDKSLSLEKKQAALLILNGIAVLHRERFLKKYGFGVPSHSFESDSGSVKAQVISLVLAVQTVMRMPLIGINIIVIAFKLILG
ncbi:Yos1-like protein, partial [Ostertagia ostertagi]